MTEKNHRPPEITKKNQKRQYDSTRYKNLRDCNQEDNYTKIISTPLKEVNRKELIALYKIMDKEHRKRLEEKHPQRYYVAKFMASVSIKTSDSDEYKAALDELTKEREGGEYDYKNLYNNILKRSGTTPSWIVQDNKRKEKTQDELYEKIKSIPLSPENYAKIQKLYDKGLKGEYKDRLKIADPKRYYLAKFLTAIVKTKCIKKSVKDAIGELLREENVENYEDLYKTLLERPGIIKKGNKQAEGPRKRRLPAPSASASAGTSTSTEYRPPKKHKSSGSQEDKSGAVTYNLNLLANVATGPVGRRR